MAKRLFSKKQYDHPEHFDDVIREYSSEGKYVPAPLEDLLYELAEHRCSICKAPYLETHHIQPREQGGLTQYENLIVVCPNCHTRIHREHIPNEKQLKQYKLKQEILYGLPILNRISDQEREYLLKIVNIPERKRIIWSEQKHFIIKTATQEEAVQQARENINLQYLEEHEIIITNTFQPITLENEIEHSIVLEIRFAPKGVRWVKYLLESGLIELLQMKDCPQKQNTVKS